MLKISRAVRDELEKVGILRFKKNGEFPEEQNFVVTNKQHRSRDKSYYVVEEQDVLLYLEKYDGLNLQMITPTQLKKLQELKLINDSKIQHPHEYKPNAIAYIDSTGQCRIKKVTNIMIALGIWKAR